jgi:tetratricopeptide (TPR) repeat protein
MSAEIAAGERGLADQEFQLAESRFRSALFEGWLLLGSLDAVDGRLIDAKHSFELAMVTAADTQRARVALALVNLRLEQYEEAVNGLRQLLLRDPGNGPTTRLLAQALVAAGRHEEAVQELEEAHEAVPDDLEITFALATGYLRVGKLELAKDLFRRVEEQRPISPTFVLVGRTYREFLQFDDAARALETALEMSPDTPRVRYYLGTLELLKSGRDGLVEALRWFEGELKLVPDDPTTNLYYGMALVFERRFDEAEPALDIAAAWGPTRLDALRFLGSCYAEGPDPGRAVETFREALDLASEAGARPRQLSTIHYQLGTVLRRLGDEAAAAPHFAAAEGLASTLIDSDREQLRRSLEDSMNTEASFDIFLPEIGDPRLLDLLPEQRELSRLTIRTAMARAYLNLGVLQAQSGHPARAVDLLVLAESLDPDLPRVQFSLGTSLFDAEEFSRATVPLAKARALDPNNTDLARMLALSYLNGGAYEEAAGLLASDPDRESEPGLQYALALALVNSGQAEAATGLFDQLLVDHASWPELRVLLGQARAQDGDFEAAEETLERALALDPDVVDANETLGDIYMRQGRLEEAESALRAELRVQPHDTQTRYRLAVVLDLARKPTESVAQLVQVLAERPSFANARYLLGKIRLADGEVEEATQHLEAAAALSPEDANICYQLAQAYQRSGRRELAAIQLERYRELKRVEHGDEP